MDVFTTMPSPLGTLTITGRTDRPGERATLTGVSMDDQRHARPVPVGADRDGESLGHVVAQLGEFLAGRRRVFDLALDVSGTAFQQRVWRALGEIPYGETVSYGELARRIGSPGAARAVGLANGRNSVAIIVPCHRVICSDGSLGGYGGGVSRKAWLLERERPAVRSVA